MIEGFFKLSNRTFWNKNFINFTLVVNAIRPQRRRGVNLRACYQQFAGLAA